MPRGVVLLVIATLVACRPLPTTQPRAPKRTPTTALAPKSTALVGLADRLDPGEVEPLSARMPQWLVQRLQVAPMEAAGAAGELSAHWSMWQGNPHDEDTTDVQRVVQFVRMATIAERTLAEAKDQGRVELLFALAPVYAFFAAPAYARARIVANDWRATALATFGPAPEPTAIEAAEMDAFVLAAARRADEVHRDALAELVRTAAADRRLPEALLRGAAQMSARDSDLAMALAKAAVDLRGAEATAAEWFALAHVRYTGLDPDGGDAALERAWKAGGADDPALAARIEQAVALGTKVRRVLELRATEDLADGIELARLHGELGRLDDAARVWTDLLARHPGDARLRVGLAKTEMARSFDLEGALATVDGAPRPLAHADREFYGLAVGVRAMWLTSTVVPRLAVDPKAAYERARPQLDRLLADIRELERLGSDAGAVLLFLAERGLEAIPAVLAGEPERLAPIARRVLPHAVELARRMPDSMDAYRLVLAGTSFSDDRAATFAALAQLPPMLQPIAPAPGSGTPAIDPRQRERADLRMQRVRAIVDAVSVWNDAERAESLGNAMFGQEQEITIEHNIAFVEMLAVVARKHPERWPEIAANFESFGQMVGGARMVRFMHNAGVANLEAGAIEPGLALLQRALESGGENVELTRIALAAMGKLEDAKLAELSTSARADVRMLAFGLQAKAAHGAERKRLQTQMRRARAQLCREAVRARALPDAGGIVLRGAIQAHVGWSAREDLVLRLSTTSEPWLLPKAASVDAMREPCPRPRRRA